MRAVTWILFLLLTFSLTGVTTSASAVTFAGQPVAPGATVRANVPLSAQEREYVSENGNTPPAQAVAVLAVPPGFDPRKPWPVLITISTDDFKRQNRDDLVDFYRSTALAEGWVLLAGDGPEYPRHGTAGWRAGMTLAAIEALYRSFPGSNKWPVACAGFSGGAKRVSDLAPLFSVAGCRMIGIFLTGVNEDRLTEGYGTFHPGRDFLRTPIFISVGQDDKIAPSHAQMEVKQSIQRTGFQRVRLDTFRGPHAVSRSQVREALRWFRELDTSR